jgi:hypothetical protein
MQHSGVTPSGVLPPVTTKGTGIASAIDLGDDGKIPVSGWVSGWVGGWGWGEGGVARGVR